MTTRMELPDLFVVVVHHNSRDTLDLTLSCLVQADVAPNHVVVVDNSAEIIETSALTQLVDGRATLVRTSNDGYAAAVNTGIEWVDAHAGLDGRAVLVLTHEVTLERTTLDGLLAALDENVDLGAVGPILRDDGSDRGGVWSAGGILTRALRLPRHLTDLPTETAKRDWLDGACVLYRGSLLKQMRLPEQYFLYMEEVDFHQQVAAAGYGVAVVPVAATQASGGMPGYYAARNIQLFQRRWGRPGLRRAAASYVVLRLLARRMARRRGDSVSRIFAGWRAGWSAASNE